MNIEPINHDRVLSLEQLMRQCGCSRMTVFQALGKYGYYSSYNHNAGFYTLADIPRFDQNGLWECGDKRFSTFRTLRETLVQLVERAGAGYSVAELEDLIGVQCRHLLGGLARDQRITREKQGRMYVYYAKPRGTQSRQKEVRAAAIPSPTPSVSLLPPGFPARTVIRTLVVVIDQPKANARQLAARLRREGTEIMADQVRTILDFYELSKKKGF